MELRPYQIEDINFLKNKDAVGIFNQQRTGKTPTALKLLEEKQIMKTLIVCPASLQPQWKEEYERWLQKPCVILSGTHSQVLQKSKSWTNGAVISYDLLKETERSSGKLDIILQHDPEAVVLDEAHRIKNPSSKVTKSIFKLIKTPVRLALTGTPAPNKPEEIYSILYWLKPETYKSYWSFINKYFNQFDITLANGKSFKQIGTFKKGMDYMLQVELASMSTQRKRLEVMPWLPKKDVVNIRLEPTKEQCKYLSELTNFFETEDVVTQGVLDRLIRYRQVCLAPQLLELKGTSPKIDWIVQYLKDYPDTPTIIFSKFTSFIHILSDTLRKKKVELGCIVGSTPIEQRQQLVKDFQNKKLKVLLINIDTGKEGLTLDTGETIIFTDKFPPIGDLEQAEDRFVSTTESKKDKPHTIINLMMKGTYDEELHKLILKRASEVDVINNYKKFMEGN